MPKEKKNIFKRWDLLTNILLPVAIVLIYNLSGTLHVPNQLYYLLGMIAALFGVSHFSKIIIEYIKLSKWSITKAVIVESRVNKIDDNESIMYEPVIKYKYSAGADEHLSDRIYPYDKFNISTLKAHTETFTVKYPEGKVLQIFYNPSNPQESFIENRGILPVTVFFLMFLLAFIIMMLAAIGVITLQ